MPNVLYQQLSKLTKKQLNIFELSMGFSVCIISQNDFGGRCRGSRVNFVDPESGGLSQEAKRFQAKRL
jgi:hypothetical protein